MSAKTQFDSEQWDRFFDVYGTMSGACISPEVLEAKIASAKEAGSVSPTLKAFSEKHIEQISAQFLRAVSNIRAAYEPVKGMIPSRDVEIQDNITAAEIYAARMLGSSNE